MKTYFKDIELRDGEIFVEYPPIPAYFISNYGRIYSTKTSKLLKWRIGKKGYARVSLQNTKNIPVDHIVHRLVAFCFIPLITGLDSVNHIDAEKLNNHVSNLEWCNQKMNMEHCKKLGRNHISRICGEDHADAIINNDIVLSIRKLHDEGKTKRELATLYNLKYKHVGKIVRREIWRHI